MAGEAEAVLAAAATRLVRQAVRVAADPLDDEALRALKRFARQSPAHIDATFEELWQQLAAAHAQLRWRALQLIAQLWDRSAVFRRSVVAHITPDFLRLVVGDASHPLPPPVRWAERLRARGIELLTKWHETYGQLPDYRPLSLALRHLQRSAAGAALAAAQAPSAAAVQSRWAEEWQAIRRNAAERLAAIRQCITQIESCLSILAPGMEELEGCASADGAVAQTLSTPPLAERSLGGAAACIPPRDGSAGERDMGVKRGTAAPQNDEGREGDQEGECEKGEYGFEEAEDGEEEPPLSWEEPQAMTHGLGMLATHPGIDIDLREPEQRREHRNALMQALRDSYKEGRHSFEPLLRGWVVTLTHVELAGEQRRHHHDLFSRVTAVRNSLQQAMTQAEVLLESSTAEEQKLDMLDGAATAQCTAPSNALLPTGGDDDDDFEFEDVTSARQSYEARLVAAAASKAPTTASGRSQLFSSLSRVQPDGAADSPVAAGTGSCSADAKISVGANEMVCEAPRRDGSRCLRLVAAGGICIFHGARVPRDQYGVPLGALLLDSESDVKQVAPEAGWQACSRQPGCGDSNASGQFRAEDRQAQKRPRPSGASSLESLKAPPSAKERLAARVARSSRSSGARRKTEDALVAEATHRSMFFNDATCSWG